MSNAPARSARPVTDLEHDVISVVLAIVAERTRADAYLRGGAPVVLRAIMLRTRITALRRGGLVRADLRIVWVELRDLGYLSVPIARVEGDGVDSAGGRHDTASQRTVEAWLFGYGGVGSTVPDVDAPTPLPGQLGVPYYSDRTTGVEYFWVDAPPLDDTTTQAGELTFYLRVSREAIARMRREQRDGTEGPPREDPEAFGALPMAGSRVRLQLNSAVYLGPAPPPVAEIVWIDAAGWTGDARTVTARAVLRGTSAAW